MHLIQQTVVLEATKLVFVTIIDQETQRMVAQFPEPGALYEVFRQALVQIPDCTLRDAQTGKYLVGTLEQLSIPEAEASLMNPSDRTEMFQGVEVPPRHKVYVLDGKIIGDPLPLTAEDLSYLQRPGPYDGTHHI